MLACVQISVVLQLLCPDICCCAHFSNFNPPIPFQNYKNLLHQNTGNHKQPFFPLCPCFFIQHPSSITQNPSSSIPHSNIEQYTASRYTPDREWIYNLQTKDIIGMVKSNFILSLINSFLPENTPDKRRLHHI